MYFLYLNIIPTTKDMYQASYAMYDVSESADGPTRLHVAQTFEFSSSHKLSEEHATLTALMTIFGQYFWTRLHDVSVIIHTKHLINEVISFIDNYPHYVLDSGDKHLNALADRVAYLSRDLRRKENTYVEYHDLDAEIERFPENVLTLNLMAFEPKEKLFEMYKEKDGKN